MKKLGLASENEVNLLSLFVEAYTLVKQCIAIFQKLIGFSGLHFQVEISLYGQPVLSSWKLNSLVDMWLRAMPKNEIVTTFGSSAKDFIMALSYGRKA